jgi:hypothetical protein
MSLTIQFQIVTDELAPGFRCELYHGKPYTDRELKGRIDPLETVALDAGLAAKFTKNPGDGYALRLLEPNGHVFARSNARANNTPSKLLVADPIGPMTVSQQEFASSAPPLPFQADEKTVFDQLALSFVSDQMRVLGHGSHDGVFNTKFSFDFRFKMDPVQIPVWTPVTELPEKETPEDTLELTETSLTIDADKSGHAGLLALLHPIIRGKFRKAIQKAFHKSILSRVGGANVHRVFTLRKSEVAGGELRLTHTVLEDSPT